jgi:hypothetical protein
MMDGQATDLKVRCILESRERQDFAKGAEQDGENLA